MQYLVCEIASTLMLQIYQFEMEDIKKQIMTDSQLQPFQEKLRRQYAEGCWMRCELKWMGMESLRPIIKHSQLIMHICSLNNM